MIGLDHFAVRGTGWKAPQLIDYAASLKLDTLFLSELGPFESFEDDYLKKLKAQADAAGLKLYTGGMSICKTARRYKPEQGTPKSTSPCSSAWPRRVAHPLRVAFSATLRTVPLMVALRKTSRSA